MKKPKGKRSKEILGKFDYADAKQQELMTSLFSAKKVDSTPQFLEHACADILSNVRECFDYCAQDIFEEYILPTSDDKTLQKYNDGKLQVYFPYFADQLVKPTSIFHKLVSSNNPLHTHLLSVAHHIKANSIIPSTNIGYKIIDEVREMVNDKKHNRIIAVDVESDSEYMVDSPGFKSVIPRRDQVGVNGFYVNQSATVKTVAGYRFQFNDEEVGRFCQRSITASWCVLEKIYLDYFDTTST